MTVECKEKSYPMPLQREMTICKFHDYQIVANLAKFMADESIVGNRERYCTRVATAELYVSALNSEYENNVRQLSYGWNNLKMNERRRRTHI